MKQATWIKINKKKPERGKKVILTDGIITKIGKLEINPVTNQEYFLTDDEPGSVFLEPVMPVHFTHWMEIPPLEETKNH